MTSSDLLRVLIIEDEEADFLLVERYLKREIPAACPVRVSRRDELVQALADQAWDIVLSDYSVPGMDFKDSLELIQARRPALPVILVSGSVGDEEAVSLVKKGVWDFVLKDHLARLAPVIEHALQEADEHRARAEAEGATRDAESALRTLVNAIPESALLTDLGGMIIAANETIARRYGRLARQLVGTSIRDLFPPEVAASRMARIEESIRTGEPARFEDRRFGRYIDNYLYPIKDERGHVKRLTILGIDVTEQKASMEKLREHAALLDIASDAILVSDLDNRIRYWSRGAERVYGWVAAETAGRGTSELLFSDAHASEATAAIAAALETGSWHGDLHQRTKAGQELVVEGRCTLMRDDKGNREGLLWVNTDVTAQRSIQAQLFRSQRLESLGTLAGGIAHDLNNVLSPILMGVEGLSLQNADISTRKILEIIKASAQRGANIVRQILNFARGMEGKLGEIQVKHVLREVESIVRETFDRAITLKVDFPKDLWPVVGDATQLHQVLMNLCVNARDAMTDGGELVLDASNVALDEAYARMNPDARPIRYVILKVEDSGSGMAPGVLEKIFDPFFTTKAPGKGTGLGLSTVRSIVKSHGGFTSVYSQVGKGTSFKIYIPAAEQGGAETASQSTEGIPMGNGELVLVVEDEITLRDITRQILESFGYRVLAALDGTEALVQFLEQQKEIRLMITDMRMPYMDGAATIRAVRRINPDLPVIATSGLMAVEYATEAKGLGANAFLAKPFTSDALLRTIHRVLNGPVIEAPPRME